MARPTPDHTSSGRAVLLNAFLDGRVLPGWLRAAVLALTPLGGWTAIALWLSAMGGHFAGDEGGDGSGIAPLLITCGIVGTLQALCLLGSPPGHRARRTLLALGLGMLHVGVVLVLVHLIVPRDGSGDALLDVFVLGTLGWFVIPLLVMVIGGLGLVVIGPVREAIALLVRACTDRSAAASARVWSASKGIAVLGVAGVALFWTAGVPEDPSHFHGIGSALVFAVELFLQSVHVLVGPPGWYFAADRIGYLISVIAVAQCGVGAVLVRRGAARRRDEATS